MEGSHARDHGQAIRQNKAQFLRRTFATGCSMYIVYKICTSLLTSSPPPPPQKKIFLRCAKKIVSDNVGQMDFACGNSVLKLCNRQVKLFGEVKIIQKKFHQFLEDKTQFKGIPTLLTRCIIQFESEMKAMKIKLKGRGWFPEVT